MILKILFNDGKIHEYNVTTVWQDYTLGMNKLYFELPFDERGKGQVESIDNIKTWQIFALS